VRSSYFAPSIQTTAQGPSSQTNELRGFCMSRLDATAAAGMTPERLRTEVERLLAELADERRIQLSAREQFQLALDLVDDMLGLGPLEPLLADDSITDIMVNGPDRVFVERKGHLVELPLRFRDAQHVARIAQRIASSIGRRVDEGSPMVDARLADGSRVNIIFPPLALDGPCLSIRKFARDVIDFERLIRFGSLTRQIARVLEIAATARLNVIISGGTGSGKTTLLNAMSRMIGATERIVTVEDAAELQLQQRHVVRLETRPPNLEGRGEVTQRDLVRNALRMRPDRIIIGEVRGTEAFDMLQAMNTGHDGSMSSVHANTTRDALMRLESMVQMSNMGLPERSIRNQVAGAIDLIVQVQRQRDGTRRVTQVTELCGLEGDIYSLNNIFTFEVVGEDADGRVAGRWRTDRAHPTFYDRLVYCGLERA
jgi:pilus assembly protein CpaF